MNLRIKSVLKTSNYCFKWAEEEQLIHQLGNNLCISGVGKPPSQFIQINKSNSHLYDFAVAPNRRFVFTAETNHHHNRI